MVASHHQKGLLIVRKSIHLNISKGTFQIMFFSLCYSFARWYWPWLWNNVVLVYSWALSFDELAYFTFMSSTENSKSVMKWNLSLCWSANEEGRLSPFCFPLRPPVWECHVNVAGSLFNRIISKNTVHLSIYLLVLSVLFFLTPSHGMRASQSCVMFLKHFIGVLNFRKTNIYDLSWTGEGCGCEC